MYIYIYILYIHMYVIRGSLPSSDLRTTASQSRGPALFCSARVRDSNTWRNKQLRNSARLLHATQEKRFFFFNTSLAVNFETHFILTGECKPRLCRRSEWSRRWCRTHLAPFHKSEPAPEQEFLHHPFSAAVLCMHLNMAPVPSVLSSQLEGSPGGGGAKWAC